MKKMLAVLTFTAGALLYADADLHEKNFSNAVGGTSKIVSVGWMDHGLKVTADAKSDAAIVYNKSFNFRPGLYYKVSGDFTGQGEIFVKMYFYNQDGTAYKVPVKNAVVRQKRDEFEAKFDLREFTAANAPSQYKVVIGVKKGGSVVLDDLELEVDDD